MVCAQHTTAITTAAITPHSPENMQRPVTLENLPTQPQCKGLQSVETQPRRPLTPVKRRIREQHASKTLIPNCLCTFTQPYQRNVLHEIKARAYAKWICTIYTSKCTYVRVTTRQDTTKQSKRLKDTFKAPGSPFYANRT